MTRRPSNRSWSAIRALHGYFARRAAGAADDLLAEAWLRAYAGRTTYDAARGPARAWLFGVARNVLAAHWRGQERHASTTTFTGEASSDPWHAVDQRLDAAAVGPLMRQTLAELPAVERELLLLIAWEQLSPTEAAAVVGVPAGARPGPGCTGRARGCVRRSALPHRFP